MARLRGAGPQIAVVVLALIAAVAGTALAGPAGITAKKDKVTKREKKRMRKVATNKANKQIDKRESGLNVNSAKSADTATSANLALGAANADKLDNLDANSLVRVAGDSSNDLPNGNGEVLTALVTAPSSGLLHIVGSVDLVNGGGGGGEQVVCELQVDGPLATGSERIIDLDGRDPCATNSVVAVGAGTHKVDLNMSDVEDPDTSLLDGALNVLFVPFDGTGG